MVRSLVVIGLIASTASAGQAPALSITADIPPGIKPLWEKGILAINAESYYQAIDCGKQGGNPACVFWDADLCKNPDFDLAMFTPYKSVAYEVWRVVRQGQPAPQPNYAEALNTRITIGITPVRGSRNTLTQSTLKRGGRAVTPIDGGLASARFTYDFAAFAPTSTVTIDMVGKERTVSCAIPVATLRRMR